MASKPLPALGLVVGLIAGYGAIVGASYATTRLLQRIMVFRTDPSHTLPWLAALLAIGLVLGLLMMIPAIGSGVTTGAGLFMTAVGVAVLLLPARTAFDFSRLFEVPGSQLRGSYLLFDGSLVLFGVVLLLVGMRRWAVDAKLWKSRPGQLQDNRGYQPSFPQQQPQQWGGYPGQPQQPPLPGQQPYHPGQQQPPYPGQQPPR
jgi:hypothetical protein